MADTVVRYWKLSLATGVAVLAVVALLLEAVARTAKQIQAGAAEIWRVGKLIAGNTVNVPLLGRINQNVAEISQAMDGCALATERIRQAAGGASRKEG
jgi:hypothetical protein